MPSTHDIKCLFLDIGGVLLTNGWDHNSRDLAAKEFAYDYGDFEARHRLAYDTFECGQLTLDEYLDLVLFYEKRSFTREQYKQFMFDQSKPYLDMIALIRHLKENAKLKIFIVNNESAELNTYRVHHFGIDQLADAFISSCYVGLRKPNPEILKLAVKISQVPKEQILYIENTPLYVEVATRLGISSILHSSYESTWQQLQAYGFQNDWSLATAN